MPFKEFCFGRLDDDDGAKSIPLGPSEIQERDAPCAAPEDSEGVPINGMCQTWPNETALAPTTVGLIYVNPGGPMGVPDPNKSVDEIRTVFGKMGHNDKGTVALIGGGHAWGKCHGPCSMFEYENPAGLPPDQAFAAGTYPYVGKCPNDDEGGVTGMGSATWTSGFEGPWTSTPTRWSNEYFTYLLDYEWEPFLGPGGGIQYRMKENPTDPRMRLVTDISMIRDPVYLEYVRLFASNMTALDEAYDFSWRNLITNGYGWSSTTKCVPYGTPPVSGLASPYTSMLNTDPR
jgi:catalase (peroxidase I)